MLHPVPTRITILHLTLLLALSFSSGCASSLHMDSKRGRVQFDEGARPVYVTNPEMEPEYEILKASGIYELSSQSNGARPLTLHPMRQYGRCANPLMLSIFTLGIVPGFLPAGRAFEYDLETDGVSESCVHELPLYERFSIWEHLGRRNEQKVLIEALARSSRERKRTAAPGAQAGDTGRRSPAGTSEYGGIYPSDGELATHRDEL